MMWINLTGVLLIVLIVWWFWLYKPKTVAAASDGLLIEVKDGVYKPAHIQVPQGQPVDLRFVRRDASPCAATVQFPDFSISVELPVDQEKIVHLPAMLPGKYPFHCQMNMYQGQLVVV